MPPSLFFSLLYDPEETVPERAPLCCLGPEPTSLGGAPAGSPLSDFWTKTKFNVISLSLFLIFIILAQFLATEYLNNNYNFSDLLPT